MDLLINFIIWFFLGAFLILLISFTVYQKSYAFIKLNKKEKLSGNKKTIGLFFTTLIISLMLCFVTCFDISFFKDQIQVYLWNVFLINLLLVFFLSLFDALFIDLFILMIWKPKILNIPQNRPAIDFMKQHIKIQFSYGWIYKIMLALLGASIYIISR